jgi:DNA-binding NtrC family response regulator
MSFSGQEPAATLETVLVVEAEVIVRTAIAQYLRDCGYRVLEAGDAKQAITILQEPEIRVDVVLSGIDFSGPMDGFELSHWVKAHSPGTDVFLAATVQRAASTAGDLCEDGPMLSKPYQPETAVERIKQLLAERARRKPK